MKRILLQAVLREVGFLLLLGFLLVSSVASAFAAGNWWPIPSMGVGRGEHTATLLQDGRVLVTGGYNNGARSSAELYDPVTNSWTSVASMSRQRDFHTATLLQDGRVLVTGGRYAGSAEIYDPGTNTWATVASMSVARYGHTATLLSNGLVLVTGGTDSSGDYWDSAEIYDPAANSWTSAGSMSVGRAYHTATLLGNGKVLVTGGKDASAEIYDPVANSWTSGGSMSTDRGGHTATLLSNGQVLVTGGSDSNGIYLDSAEIYDPVADSWTAAASINESRSGHGATRLGDGRVLVTGGYPYTDSAEIYDPVADTWTTVPSMGTDRASHTATALVDGRVMVAGGFTLGGSRPSAEIYDPVADTWTAVSSMNESRGGHRATRLLDGRVLVSGGCCWPEPYSNVFLDSAEIYDPVADTWTTVPPMSTYRSGHTATMLANGWVLVSGGYNYNFGDSLDSAEIYDPVANSWIPAGLMSVRRANHTATLLGNGKVLVTGGIDEPPGLNRTYLNSAEIYDPVTNTWTGVAPMSTYRYGHTATLLLDGRVLVSGGYDGNSNSYIDSAEIYDPGTNSWMSVAPMSTYRIFHTATRLINGRVIVAAGTNLNGDLDSAEIYDPGTNSWTAAASMGTDRSSHDATLLIDGRVLVSGGSLPTGTTATAEIYDPVTNTWTFTYSMIVRRSGHTATPLLNGKVLVSGGGDGSSALASAEIYDESTNQPPIADAGGPYNVDEGGTVTLNGTGSDGNGDPLTYSWDLDNDGAFETPGQEVTFSAELRDGPDSQIVVLQVCDDAACSTDTATVNIDNVAPTADAHGPYNVNEGGSVALEGTASDFSGDVLTFEWDLDNDGTFEALGHDPTFLAISRDGPDTQTVVLRVCDDEGGCNTNSTTVNILNMAPMVAADNTSVTVEAGQMANNTGTYSDVAADTVTISASVGTVTQSGTNSGTWSWSFLTSGAGDSQTVTITATDDDGDSSTTTFDLTVNSVNTPPSVEVVNSSVTVDEGQTANNTGTYSDGDAGNVIITASVGTVSKTGTNSGTWSWSLDTIDGPDQSQTVTVTATDPGSASSSTTFLLTVNNVAPVVGSITAPIDPVPVNAAINASASFTDVGTADTHTAQWNWGDTTSSAGTVTETEGSGSVSGSHTYSAPGIYVLRLTVTDDDGGSETAEFRYVVVYDPNGSFVTGGGWIMSPPGACQFGACTENTTGKANFGFVSKYKKGANAPTGKTEFQFQAGNLNFNSTAYEWLVVAGARAQFKGTGTINGAGSYGFMLTAIDGQVNGGGGADKFRIKIWYTNGDSDIVVYDNLPDQIDDADPPVIGGGSIVIHQKGKTN